MAEAALEMSRELVLREITGVIKSTPISTVGALLGIGSLNKCAGCQRILSDQTCTWNRGCKLEWVERPKITRDG